jgi:hypothetical protein
MYSVKKPVIFYLNRCGDQGQENAKSLASVSGGEILLVSCVTRKCRKIVKSKGRFHIRTLITRPYFLLSISALLSLEWNGDRSSTNIHETPLG